VRLLIGAVGRLKAGPERELAERYRERLDAIGRGLALGPLSIVEIDESRARRPEDRRADEAERLVKAIGDATLVVLDETGRALDSPTFAARLGRWRDDGVATLAFLIGGADGHDPAILSRASLVLSFGAMTWPHQIARLLLAEQLYRAATILAGHPYHRE
jgi:23S rRNA (pseudouridine1915-N3)-methyltransferase